MAARDKTAAARKERWCIVGGGLLGLAIKAHRAKRRLQQQASRQYPSAGRLKQIAACPAGISVGLAKQSRGLHLVQPQHLEPNLLHGVVGVEPLPRRMRFLP